MKVYDEHGHPYSPPEPPRRDSDRNDGPQTTEQATEDDSTVDLTELLAGDA